jgi:hypothetical protein
MYISSSGTRESRVSEISVLDVYRLLHRLPNQYKIERKADCFGSPESGNYTHRIKDSHSRSVTIKKMLMAEEAPLALFPNGYSNLEFDILCFVEVSGNKEGYGYNLLLVKDRLRGNVTWILLWKTYDIFPTKQSYAWKFEEIKNGDHLGSKCNYRLCYYDDRAHIERIEAIIGTMAKARVLG